MATGESTNAETGEAAKFVEPLPISKLEGKGFTSRDIGNLTEAGFDTVESVIYAPKKHLLTVRGMSEVKVNKLLVEAGKLIPTGFTTATAFHRKSLETATDNVPESSNENITNVVTSHVIREDILREFDMDRTYGPAMNITRLERYNRAIKFNLSPPPSKMIYYILTNEHDYPGRNVCCLDKH